MFDSVDMSYGNGAQRASGRAKVYLIGAGRGDPELLTLKAEALRLAA